MAWVRVLVGAVWINGGVEKLLNGDFPQQFTSSLQAGGFVSQAPPFFQSFMESFVIPNSGTIAQLVRIGELSLGIVLILGLLTNLAAIGSIGMSIAIMLSQGGVSLGTGLGAPQFLNVNLILALLAALVLFSAAAKTFSIDSVIAKRNPGLSPLLTNSRKHR
ncbi:MAG: TQO small subunit DoxD [Rubrobacteraceae bacterium]